MTNADRIRTMTDEELAEWECDRSCLLCPVEDCNEQMVKKCKQRWLDWLKQEVSEAEEG